MSEPNIIVEPSSGDEKTISTINTPTGCLSTPNSQCPICLDEFTNPCHTNICLHRFCFECLRKWSKRALICPLCRRTFDFIYHSFNDLGVHETYDIPICDRPPTQVIVISSDDDDDSYIEPLNSISLVESSADNDD